MADREITAQQIIDQLCALAQDPKSRGDAVLSDVLAIKHVASAFEGLLDLRQVAQEIRALFIDNPTLESFDYKVEMEHTMTDNGESAVSYQDTILNVNASDEEVIDDLDGGNLIDIDTSHFEGFFVFSTEKVRFSVSRQDVNQAGENLDLLINSWVQPGTWNHYARILNLPENRPSSALRQRLA